jgi:hypothetical protein
MKEFEESTITYKEQKNKNLRSPVILLNDSLSSDQEEEENTRASFHSYNFMAHRIHQFGNFVVRRPTSAGPLLSLWGALGLGISDAATLNGRLLLRGGLVFGNGLLLSRRLLRGGVLFPRGKSLCNTRFFLDDGFATLGGGGLEGDYFVGGGFLFAFGALLHCGVSVVAWWG